MGDYKNISVFVGPADLEWLEEYDERYPDSRSDAIKRHMQWGMVIDELIQEHNIPEPTGPRDLRMRLDTLIADGIEHAENCR